MRLEAIADLLGHRTLRMTMRYARIANQTIADEYQAVSDQVRVHQNSRFNLIRCVGWLWAHFKIQIAGDDRDGAGAGEPAEPVAAATGKRGVIQTAIAVAS